MISGVSANPVIETYLLDIILIFGCAIVVLYFGHKLKIPGVVGFLITGMIIGPYGLGFIEDPEIVTILSQVGIIFLLFTIGMQFSFRTLYEMRKTVLVGGSIQVLLTIGVVYVLAFLAGVPAPTALFLGFLVCHSSTTVTLKVFQDRGEVETPQGRTTLGISLFQDLMSIPMIIALPLIAGQEADITESLLRLGLSLGVMVVLILLIAVYLLPRILDQVTSTRSPEIFLLSVILICFIITWITARIGLSLALGAFLAGLTLAESEYFHQAFASIIPLRDIFTSFFFISIGMLLNIGFLATTPALIFVLVGIVLFIKASIAGGAALALGQSIRTSTLSGLALCNIGEFAFILIVAGEQFSFMNPDGVQVFLAVAVITISLTPLAIAAGPRLAEQFCRIPFPDSLRRGCVPPSREMAPPLRDHVVIIGYGLNGRNLSRATKASGIPYMIIDLNPDTVARERGRGEPIFFGDATNASILMHARIAEARILVVAINDPISVRAITGLAREMNPGLFIITRTRFESEVEPLKKIGADEVVPEEFETSVEIFTRVLRKYLIPREQIEALVREVRSGTYQMFRNIAAEPPSLQDLARNIPDVEISTHLLSRGSRFAGSSLAGLNVRKNYGISVLAIQRDGEMIANPGGEMVLEPGDRVTIIGKAEEISRFSRFLAGEGGADMEERGERA